MALPFFKCSKHGVVKFRVIHECEVCAAENRCTQPTTTNKQSDEIIAEIMEYINKQCERHRSVDYHIDAMVALRCIKRIIAR